jgi:DNA-binding transcriptional MerR regulator
MARSQQQDRTYSPAEICEWFDIPRTTLFRWEDSGEVPRAERGPRGQRIYRQRHLRRIADVVRTKAHDEISLSERHDLEGPSELLERVYKAELFGSDDPKHGLEQLKGLATGRDLSPKTVRILVNEALGRPRGDDLRRQVWDLLLAYDRSGS